MRTLTLYAAPGCHLCEQALDLLVALRRELAFRLVEVDVTAEEGLHRAYFDRIPVIALDGEELFEYFIEEDELRRLLCPEGA